MRLHLRRDGGSVSVLAACVLFVAGVLALVSVDVMRTLQARATAQTAADAAALAAAQEIALPSGRAPTDVAAEYASRNGGALLTCSCEPGTSEAEVQVEAPVTLVFLPSGRTVTAAARAVIGAGTMARRWPGPSDPEHANRWGSSTTRWPSEPCCGTSGPGCCRASRSATPIRSCSAPRSTSAPRP